MPLTIHFLNVGQGDCTVIDSPSGRLTLVDINNCKTLDASTRAEVVAHYRATRMNQAAQSQSMLERLVTLSLEQDYVREQEARTTDPIAYLDHWLPRRDVFRMIVTHPDMDHMTGLHRLYSQSGRSITNFWHAGPHDFNLAATTDQEWVSCPYDKRDWDTYKFLRSSATNPKNLRLYAGHSDHFWTDDGIEILAPSVALEQKAVELDQPNAISTVLLIRYAGINVLLGGDATEEHSWPDICSRVALPPVSILKASHHGRRTGYYQPAVKALSPWLTITSVGQAEHDATDLYRQYSERTVSLRDAGDIRVTIHDNGQWSHETSLPQHWKERKVPPVPSLVRRSVPTFS